ncbi:MAG: hypothetical protein HYV63_01610 [Candidatus Schekmanbacteria bacterium]|nr:hypothetical protein [Candidatus Schekmanbacteria bacterium]
MANTWNEIVVVCPGHMGFAQMHAANAIVSHALGESVSLRFSMTEQGVFVGSHVSSSPLQGIETIQEALETVATAGGQLPLLLLLLHDGALRYQLSGTF